MLAAPALVLHVSRRREHWLAAVLLAAFTGLLLLGAVIPQRASLAPLDYARWRTERAPLSLWLEAAGFTAAPRAPWLPIVSAPLAVLLAQCTARRSLRLVGRWRRGRVTSASLRQGGSICFHACLLVGLSAVVLSAGTRFAGHAELAPGAGLLDDENGTGYIERDSGWWSPPASGITLRLDGLRLATWPDGSLREHSADLTLLQRGRAIGHIALVRGQPVDIEGMNLFLDSRTGPAVLLTASMADGSARTGWVHFPAAQPHGPSLRSALGDNPPGGPGAPPPSDPRRGVDGRAPNDKPDDARRGVDGRAPNDSADDASTVIVIPGTRLRVDARLDSAGLTLRESSGTEVHLAAGDTAHLNGVDLRLERIDAWTSLTVVRDPFAGIALAAFALGLLGLAVTVLPVSTLAWRAPGRVS